MNNLEDILRQLLHKPRNIYQLSDLYSQSRNKIDRYIENLRCTACDNSNFMVTSNELKCKSCNHTFPIDDDVVDFRNLDKTEKFWETKNQKFLEYHKALTVYTLLNSRPISSYIGYKTGISQIKNKTIIDVGAGTGQTYTSFFYHPETLEYYLIDPNLRLLHDQFIRIYPQILTYPLNHILGFAEKMPIKNDFADIVLSLASIDHFEDYKKFIIESHRILKKDGLLLVHSRLAMQKNTKRDFSQPLFAYFEWFARKLFQRKYHISIDCHTFDFGSSEPIYTFMADNGFKITQKEEFDGYFYIVGQKL